MATLAEKLVRVSTLYLGPAARVFLERQARLHLGRSDLDALTRDELPSLLYWISRAGRLIIRERADLLVRQLVSDLGVAALAVPPDAEAALPAPAPVS